MRRQLALLIAAISFTLASPPASAADLTEAQKQVLAQAENYLKQLEMRQELPETH